ncbi:MAG: glycosyltransferase family 4 protein [bacterium]
MKRMQPIPQFPKIAFIMPSLVDMLPSGVTTFVRQMADGFCEYGDSFRVVEIPHGNYEPEVSGAQCRAGVLTGMVGKSAAEDSRYYKNREDSESGAHVGPVTPPATDERAPLGTAATTVHIKPVSLSLFWGYLKLLWIDIRRVWAVRGQCRHRFILTNQFGCETLPVALRLVFPLARIVAISHTHPGNGAEANHWVRRWVERACYWSLNDILYNSGSSRREWAGKLGLPSSKGRVIHLGTEPPDLSIPDDYPSRQEGIVDFLCVARFVSWKGQGSLIRVWREVIKRGERCARLVLIGDGQCLDAVRRDAEEAGLGSCVVFMGGRPNADRYFNAANVAVLLSSEPEAFGLTLLEAMSREKPVLASRMGGIPEIVVHEETGLLVSPNDYEKVADGVCYLTSSVVERQRLGKNGRQRWEDCFTVERMIRRYESYFMDLDMKGKR